MSIYQCLLSKLSLPVINNISDLESIHLTKTNQSLLHVMESGLRCESIGLAFAAGYRSALQKLLPTLDVSRWAAMCVTEATGNHPRQIKATITADGIVNGEKSFVTLADRQPQLIVVAKAGETDGLPVLKAAFIDGLADQVNIELMPPLPMVPEISHGKITFDFARASLLEGDGYSDYSKRFRTLEDVHVLAGFASVLTSLVYRYKLPVELLEQCLVLLNSILATEHELENETPILHLHLAGLFESFKELCQSFEYSLEQLPAHISSSWLRDKKLFGVANKARQARRERAHLAIQS